jgi:hypothetical protein
MDEVFLEEHQKRLVAKTIMKYLPIEWEEFLNWMKSNIEKISELVLARGLMENPSDRTSHIWYFNKEWLIQLEDLAPEGILSVSEIVQMSTRYTDEVGITNKNGGSVIQLPFGSLQMHSPSGVNQMQFRCNMDKVRDKLGLKSEFKKAPTSGKSHSDAWKKSKDEAYSIRMNILQEFLDNPEFACRFSEHFFGHDLGVADFDGSNAWASEVSDVFGGMTKGKSNLNVHWSTGEQLNISLKSSKDSQVYLVSVDRFIDGYEKIYEPISGDIKKVLRLFIGSDQILLSEFMVGKNYHGPKYKVKDEHGG